MPRMLGIHLKCNDNLSILNIFQIMHGRSKHHTQATLFAAFSERRGIEENSAPYEDSNSAPRIRLGTWQESDTKVTHMAVQLPVNYFFESLVGHNHAVFVLLLLHHRIVVLNGLSYLKYDFHTNFEPF